IRRPRDNYWPDSLLCLTADKPRSQLDPRAALGAHAARRIGLVSHHAGARTRQPVNANRDCESDVFTSYAVVAAALGSRGVVFQDKDLSTTTRRRDHRAKRPGCAVRLRSISPIASS